MDEQRLIEALNDSVERLHNGQTIEDCLGIYPDMADELRDLLYLTGVPGQLHIDVAEVQSMRTRLDAQIAAQIDSAELAGSWWRIPNGAAVLLAVAVMAIIFGIILFIEHTVPNDFAVVMTETVTETTTDTPEPTATYTASIESTATETMTATSEPTATTQVAVPTATEIMTETPTTADEETTPTATVDVPFTEQQAIEIAQMIFPASQVNQVELETWDEERLVWDIELDDSVRAVDIDAETGQVLFFGFEVDDDNQLDGVVTQDPTQTITPTATPLPPVSDEIQSDDVQDTYDDEGSESDADSDEESE